MNLYPYSVRHGKIVSHRLDPLTPADARRMVDEAIMSADRVMSRGGHRHWLGHPPFGLVQLTPGKTRRGMFMLARFNHLIEVGRLDLLGKVKR